MLAGLTSRPIGDDVKNCAAYAGRKVVRWRLRARRRRLGTVGTENRDAADREEDATRTETSYADRRGWKNADTARQHDQRRVRGKADAPHLACRVVIVAVMHRTGFVRPNPPAAFGYRVGGVGAGAAQCGRGNGKPGDLAHEPGADHPRQTTADQRHQTT